MSAMPAMTTSAVSPYHQSLVRERFADRTAARLRLARVDLAIRARLAAGAAGNRRAPRGLDYCRDTARGEIDGRERQQHRACAGEPPARKPPRRAVMLDQHPVRPARRRASLD